MITAACIHLIYARITAPIGPLWADWHAVMIRGEGSAPLQYRWLSYAIPDLAIRAGIGAQQAYLAMRFMVLAVALFIVGETVRTLIVERMAAVASVLAVGVYYAASSYPHIQPAEELNLMFFGLLVLLVLRDAPRPVIVVVFTLAMLNKETVGFLIPFVLLVERERHGGSLRVGLRMAGALAVSFLVAYVVIRLHFGTDRPYLGGLVQLENNLRYWQSHPLGGSMWLWPSLVPVGYLIWRWKRTPIVFKCFIPTVLLFVVGHVAISAIQEFRTYTVLAAMTWAGVAVALGCATLSETGHPSHDAAVGTGASRCSREEGS